MDVAIETMGNRDASSFEIDSFYISGEGLCSPKQLAKRIDDRVHFEIARRDLVQHRREQKMVVARHQGDVDVVAAAQRSFQLDRCVNATEPAAEYKNTAGATFASFVLRRATASGVIIFGLIQLIRALWNRPKLRTVP